MKTPLEIISRIGSWLHARGMWWNVGLVFIAAAVFTFVEIAEEVQEKEGLRWDGELLRAIAWPDAPHWAIETSRDITALGSMSILSLVTLGMCGFLLLYRARAQALFVLLAVLGGLGVNAILKGSFARPRPDIIAHRSFVSSSSFPSAHSMLSAIVYLTLAFLLARFLKERRMKLYVIIVAAFVTFLVGMSRVFQGVHYPTDVAAGWLGGLTWATLCWMVSKLFVKSRTVETVRPS